MITTAKTRFGRSRFLVFLFSLIPFTFSPACVSLVEKAGQALDGSAFAEKKTAVYAANDMELWETRDRAGRRSFVIRLNNYPTIKIRCSDINEQGEFRLVSLDYLGGGAHGWNEFRMDIAGEGRFLPGGATATFSLRSEIEKIQLSAAAIRRYDTRLAGNEALTGLKNRYERIKAVAGWMKDGGTGAPADAPGGTDIKNFEKYWKPVLFPETVSKRKRPPGWLMEGDQRNRAESISWNKGYTERLLPEELREIRNSGTMLRDWEEALDWLYNEYEWDRIQETLSRETVLKKKGTRD